MDSPAPSVPATSWRAEKKLWSVGGSTLIQPGRVDVLVHLLAIEQLVGARYDDVSPDSPWVLRSEAFTSSDNEVSVAQLAAELLTSPSASLDVAFASGGQIVRGASSAGAALYAQREWTRVEGRDKTIDRSTSALLHNGWDLTEIRMLLRAWSARDERAAVVVLDMDALGWEEAMHELSCRYDVMHSEIDFVAPAEAAELTAQASGSSQIVCLRAEASGLANVLAPHGAVISLSAVNAGAASLLESLWNVDRTPETSGAHEQRLRKMRRRQMVGQLLDRARGR